MTIQADTPDAGKTFSKSLALAHDLAVMLSSDATCGMTHSQVEALVHTQGTELLRRFLQDHFDLRTLREEVAPSVVGADGVERTHRREVSRQLETVFGTVGFTRMQYGADGTHSLRPLDMELNMPPDHYSSGVRRHVAIESVTGSFDALVDKLAKSPGARVGKRQAQGLAVSAQDISGLVLGMAPAA